ncbi:long-chain fatty acid transporter fat1 [Neophaeococcomyces mojaviensis]|uniref:Long-chain fatty acid transporter fat1 n=1 Tax=Neophaeococcomyces mojaviensis TaxID=3383035 RepID=A0ACC2ZWE8_9EURO|nr:long-chain fatty acid transporter fat1 [Knufia sp. JES_112]
MAGSVPLTTLAVAAVAAGAYINAKFRLPGDIAFLSGFATSQRQFAKREKAKRISNFCVLEEHATNAKTANEIFLIYEGKSWTFKQSYDTVLRYAGWLYRTHGVVSGEIVALDFMNSPQFLFLLMAVWSLGASPAFINYNLTSKPLIHSVRVSTARLLIVDPEVAPKALTDETKEAFLAPNFRNNAFPLEIAVLHTGLQSSLNYFPPYRAPDTVHGAIKPTDVAALMYTSGTTGMPKAAIVPWSRMSIGGNLCGKILGLRPVNSRKPDRFYTCMPLYHTTGFTLGFNACLHSATTLVIGRKFSVSKFWPEVRSSKVTIIQYVGETLRYLLAAPPSPDDRNHKVRMAFGNGLRPDVWKRFKARFGIETITEVYGMTEGVSATWNVNRNDFTDGAIGSYGKITELMNRKTQAIVLVDWETEQPWRDPETGLCKAVPRGEVGELLFALDPATLSERFQGYLNNKDATNKKLVWNVLKKGDVYFRTGDVVRFDNEGRLWFSDRIGDTFRWKSENVSTAEVSEVIGHHRSVHEANIYGVSVPGHEGRAGCAAILLKDEALQDGKGGVVVKDEVLESLATYAANSLPKYAVPLFLRVVKEVTLTGNNKQQKVGLRNQGVDLAAIKEAGSPDKIFWLKPGARQYTEFHEADLKALEASKVRL